MKTKTNIIYNGDSQYVLKNIDQESIDVVYFYPPNREGIYLEKLNFAKDILKDKGIFLYRLQHDQIKEDVLLQTIKDISEFSTIEILSHGYEEFNYATNQKEDKKDVVLVIQKNYKENADELLKKENYHQKHGFELRLQEIIKDYTSKNSIVMDVYSNDGNFLKYVKSIGRKFIGIDKSYTACIDTAKNLAIPFSSILKVQEFGLGLQVGAAAPTAEEIAPIAEALSRLETKKKAKFKKGEIKKERIFRKDSFVEIPQFKKDELFKLLNYFKKTENIKKDSWHLFEIRKENKEISILSDKHVDNLAYDPSFFISLSDLPRHILKTLENIPRISTCLQKHNGNGFLIKTAKNLKVESVYLPPNETDAHYLSNKLIDSLKSWKKADKKEKAWLQKFYENLSAGFLKSAGAAIFAAIIGFSGYLIGSHKDENMKADTASSLHSSAEVKCDFKYKNTENINILNTNLTKNRLTLEIDYSDKISGLPNILFDTFEPKEIVTFPSEKNKLKVVFEGNFANINEGVLKIGETEEIKISKECK